MAGPFTDQALWARVIRRARCADGTHDPEQWFPVSVQIQKARHEAAAAIAVCAICPVRAQCLALSLRHWDIGQQGIWGGLVAAERAAARRLLRAHMVCVRGTSAAQLDQASAVSATALGAGRPLPRRCLVLGRRPAGSGRRLHRHLANFSNAP